MRVIALTFLLPTLLLPLAACHDVSHGDSGTGIAGTGSGTSRSYAATGFTSVEAAGSDDVDIRVGQAFSVRADGPSTVLDQLRIEVKGDRLEIGRRNHGWVGHDAGKVTVHVTLPRLTGTGVAGSGDITVDRVDGDAFKAELAGSGDLSVGHMAVSTLSVDVAGSGKLRTAGNAGTLKVDIAGAGDIDAAGLTARSATVSIAGSGNVRAAVDGNASVSIMGTGDVDLGPRARCQTSKMGTGSVRCGG